jgi:hypothetical protein
MNFTESIMKNSRQASGQGIENPPAECLPAFFAALLWTLRRTA